MQPGTVQPVIDTALAQRQAVVQGQDEAGAEAALDHAVEVLVNVQTPQGADPLDPGVVYPVQLARHVLAQV